MRLDIAGTTGPVELADCPEIYDALMPLLAGWPVAPAADADSGPPAISVQRNDGMYRISASRTGAEDCAYSDATDTVCAFIAELIMAYATNDPGMLCLHAGGVLLDGRLFLFPSTRKAGKSTLTVELAAAGGLVFSDDVMPVRAENGNGMALGIAPRLRLPLPDRADERMRDFVAGHMCLNNAYYGYVAPRSGDCADWLAPLGKQAPIAAFVTLDRNSQGGPALSSGSRADMMKLMIRQNFGLGMRPPEIVETIHDMIMATPCLQLTYRDGCDAVALLRDYAANLNRAAAQASA